jgi:hypothetical protein
LWVPVFHSFYMKKVDFSWVLGKNIYLFHFFDPIQYELWFNTLI